MSNKFEKSPQKHMVKSIKESDLDPDEVETVMNQVGCSHEQAVEALIKSDNNLVDAILELAT